MRTNLGAPSFRASRERVGESLAQPSHQPGCPILKFLSAAKNFRVGSHNPSKASVILSEVAAAAEPKGLPGSFGGCTSAYTAGVEFIKIVFVCIVASILYGIVHDQVTARICVEYFTVFHPPVFATQSPTLLGIGWGVIATWWAGAIVGMLVAIAAQLGTRAQLTARDVTPMIARLLLFMACCAFVFGIIGYFKGVMPIRDDPMIPASMHRRFLADWWAHSASYASGFIGGLAMCATIAVKRVRRLHQLVN
jgi:hypothetical protein